MQRNARRGDHLVRGSHGIDFKERIKIMKLLWDAIGTEFGGRHELYEYNYVATTRTSASTRC
jgi:aromatic ring hydroxylase